MTNTNKEKLELKDLLNNIWVSRLTIISLVIGLIASISSAANIKESMLPDFSKSNNLTPHTVKNISFIGKNTTGAQFWYEPKIDKNQGYRMRILEDYYVVIKSTHNVKISILDSEGDYIPLVSFMDNNWVFQSPKNDNYTIVFGGNIKAEITVDIPPLSTKEQIMEYERSPN